MPDKPPEGVHEAISRLLESKLKEYAAGEPDLNLAACTKIYQTIFEGLVEVFEASDVQIQNESMNFLAQLYYDGVLINARHELDPDIFTQRAKVENIETKELALLATMMRGTDFMIPFVKEIKRRN